jgi:hypothetical protein
MGAGIFADHKCSSFGGNLFVSGECCRRSWVRVRFAFFDVHALNETVRDGIDVPHLAIRKDIAINAFHELMNSDLGNAAFTIDELQCFHVGIELLPLTAPVGPNLLFPDDPPSDALGQLTFSLMSARALSISR